MNNFVEKVAKKYLKLFAYIEGPELDANILHSHFFAAKALRSFEDSINPKLDGLILDVGAGTGYGKRLLSPKAKYFPTDLETARDYQDKSLAEDGIPLEKICSVYNIDYNDNFFDACLALNLFEHLQYPARAIKEITRVVKKNGIVIFLVPFCYPIHGYPDDYWRWTEEGVRTLMEENRIKLSSIAIHGKSVHAIILNINFFIRYGIFMNDRKIGTISSVSHILLRPVLTVFFLLFNLIGLVTGFFDKSTTSPILVSCVGQVDK